VLAELKLDDHEEEVAHRDGARYVHRLVKTSAAQLPMRPASPEAAASYRLQLGSISSIDQLAFHACPRRAPAAGEVEIEVHAAGLNFRDVMKALGIYPSEDDADNLLGDECAGRIVAIGEGVADFQIGEEVVAMGPGSFGSHVTHSALPVVRKPAGISFDEAATIPVAFLTAWYALHHLGRLRAGERVLIHAAAGGVGLAAVQVAQHLGAEIFATAGSAEKREFLRSLGVRHVMDSRALAFADEVRTLTGGRGVDVVLNSLSGEAIVKGISCLAPRGRFLEIGKRDIFQNTKLGLRPFRNNLSLFAIDLAQVLRDEPALIQTMLHEVMAHVAAGRLRPAPLRAFPMSKAPEAFREMAQARHIGKIVLSRESDRVLPVPVETPMRFKADASYLITGGLSGFGLAVAEWMLRSGARHLVLVGRTGAASDAAQQAVTRLRDLGGEVLALAADVASAADVERVFATIAGQLPPLRGIVHSAMIIDDSTLLQQSRERFQRVMAPKVSGAWNLHTHTTNLELDFFVLFSSVSAVIGNAGQSSYAAANCFLDALAHHRRAQGLPALVVDWGMLSDVGYVSRTDGLAAALHHHGLSGFSAAEATTILGRLLQTCAVQVGAFRFRWQKGAESLSGLATSPRFAELFSSSSSTGTGDTPGTIEAILALPPGDRLAALTALLAEAVAHVLRTSAARLDVHRPLTELGLDSLMSVELTNRLEATCKVPLAPGTIGSGVSVAKLAGSLLGILTGAPAAPALLSNDLRPSPQPRSAEPLTTASVPPPEVPAAAPEISSAPIVPAAPLQPSKALRARFYFEWLALRGLLACFRGGDFQRARNRLQLITPVMTRVLRHDWQWAVQNLKLIFGPNLTNAGRERLATLAFEHHLSSYLEGLRHKDLEVAFHHPERLFENHAEGRGVILCGVHLGSWESVLHHGAQAGLPIVGVYRRALNPRSDRVFQEIRSAYGIEWIVSKDVEAITRALRAGKIVGLMTDLNTTAGGTVADFLGVPATCPAGPARLALLQNAPILPAVAIRTGAGRISVHFEPAIRPPQNDHSDEEVRQLTRRMNAAFEPWILEYAEQYNWLHPRWRNRPDGHRWRLQMSDAELWHERTSPFPAVSERVRRLLTNLPRSAATNLAR
jgi:NADPH:quinone reductase-like Zn-dependent oxidoreductase/lauroyl/myristoyl acyltransferase/NADP-dependent 3-hydroxy acid dehydrogenase YdfG